MHKCIDCKKEVSRKEYIRCNSCNIKYKFLNKKEHKCICCGKKLNNFYAKRCEKCWHNFAVGKNNPNHIHGKNCKDAKCIDCGNSKSMYAERCMKCYGRIISEKLTGRIISKETRKKIGLANKDKKVSSDTRIKLSLSHGGTGIPYERRKYPWKFYLIRKSILKRDNHICQKCFKKGNTVHHIDYNKVNCGKDNLITLCNQCNLNVNFDKNNWKIYFQEKIILTKIKGDTKNATV